MTKKILCDTDFFVALLIADDMNNDKAMKIIQKYSSWEFVYSNLTKYELMTVLSRKLDQKNAVKALNLFEDTFQNMFEFDALLESEIISFYKQSINKNQSFFDVTCLIIAKKNNYKIASFDKFYPSDLLAN